MKVNEPCNRLEPHNVMWLKMYADRAELQAGDLLLLCWVLHDIQVLLQDIPVMDEVCFICCWQCRVELGVFAL